MSQMFNSEFQKSMDTLHFSSEAKEQLRARLVQQLSENKKREVKMMHKTYRKGLIVAAACLMLTGVTAVASTVITSYRGRSSAFIELHTVDEMSAAQKKMKGTRTISMPAFPETLGGSYVLKGGNLVDMSGEDADGGTVDSWQEICGRYQDTSGREVDLTMSFHPIDDGGRTASEQRVLQGIAVDYNADEYLFLPPSDEDHLDPDIAARKESDAHFFVSYGSSQAETVFYKQITFMQNGISYDLITKADLGADEMFSMADELISHGK